jgi:hypothetical protein
LKSSQDFVAAIREIIDQPHPQLGVDNNWLSFYPYQVEAGPGDTLQYELKVRNWLDRPSRIRSVILAPDQWKVTPSSIELQVAAGAESSAPFRVQIPMGETRVNRRWVITGDVWRDGEHLGEIAELLVNMKPMKAH